MFARVERQPRGGDRWPPHDFRAFEIFQPRDLTHGNTRILTAVGSNRPSVVCTALDDICLIATLWPVFRRPKIAGFWMEAQTKLVPMTQRIDFRKVGRVTNKGIVVWHRSIVIQPQQLPEMHHRVLGKIAC